MAVADGQVVRIPYPFYDVVWAVEVSHPGIGLIRYGEVAAPPPSTWIFTRVAAACRRARSTVSSRFLRRRLSR